MSQRRAEAAPSQSSRRRSPPLAGVRAAARCLPALSRRTNLRSRVTAKQTRTHWFSEKQQNSASHISPTAIALRNRKISQQWLGNPPKRDLYRSHSLANPLFATLPNATVGFERALPPQRTAQGSTGADAPPAARKARHETTRPLNGLRGFQRSAAPAHWHGAPTRTRGLHRHD